jgi:hypothetical protein
MGKAVLTVFILWTASTYAIVLGKDGWSRDNATHVAIMIYGFATVAALPLLRRAARRFSPAAVFLGASVVSALVVEACYMPTAPIHPSLVVAPDMPVRSVLRNLAVDWTLALPAYIAIFAVAWAFIARFEYGVWAYALVFATGQALGDAKAYLGAHPAMLVFLPYILVNYLAMSVVPFAAVRDQLPPGRSRRALPSIALPLVVLPLVYGACGTAVIALGKWMRLLV